MDDGIENGGDSGISTIQGGQDDLLPLPVDEVSLPVLTEAENNHNAVYEIAEPNTEISLPPKNDLIPLPVEAKENVPPVEEMQKGAVKVSYKQTSTGEQAESVENETSDVFTPDTVPQMISELNTSISDIREQHPGTEKDKQDLVGEKVQEAFLKIGSSEMSNQEKVLAMNEVYRHLPPEARCNLQVPRASEYLVPDGAFDKNGNPQYLWNKNLGFEGKPQAYELSQGMVLDRYGNEFGTYLCEVKEGKSVVFESRELPYAENPQAYHQYEVTGDLSNFSTHIANLTIEDIEQIEIQRDMSKPESERRTMEQIREAAESRYDVILTDVSMCSDIRADAAQQNGWTQEFEQAEGLALKGKIDPVFSKIDGINPTEIKEPSEQICLPASVDTLIYLGYLKEIKS